MEELTRLDVLVIAYKGFRDSGMRHGDSYRKLLSMGYTKSERQLRNHLAAVEATGHALYPCAKNNSSFKLNQAQMDETDDWISAQNAENAPFSRRKLQTFIKARFDIEVHPNTVGNILKRLSMSRRACKTKSPGFIFLDAELRVMYWTYILKLRATNSIHRHPSEICSIDTTYTRKPTDKSFTYIRRGSPQPKSKHKTFLYTDSIVTMIWADGVNRTPCILFTYNPRMAPTQPNTVRGRETRMEFTDALARTEIDESRVLYVKSKKNYFGENSEMYEAFLTRYNLDKNVAVFHDAGKGFKKGPVSVFDKLEFANHIEYPSDVHQYLSPNDNNLHGAAKQKWKLEYNEFETRVEAPLRLMQLIDCDAAEHSQWYFRRNILNVKQRDLDTLI